MIRKLCGPRVFESGRHEIQIVLVESSIIWLMVSENSDGEFIVLIPPEEPKASLSIFEFLLWPTQTE